MAEALKTIRLGGILGKKFGRVHRFSIASPAEAIRALCSQFAGFQQFLSNAKDKGLAFVVLSGDRDLTPDELQYPCDDVRIVPVVIGSKSGGLFNIIIGVVLIALAFVPGLQFAAPYLLNAGISMIIGGVVQMLSPAPKAGQNNKANNIPNYSFNGSVNTTAQGGCVPVLYGNLKVGSAVISGGITTTDGVYVPTVGASGGSGTGSGGGGGGGFGDLHL